VKSVYAYAGIEFRPLQVTDEGSFSTAIIEGSKPDSSTPANVPHNELLAYEEVTIPSGNFDKINPEYILVKSNDSGGGNNALAAFTTDMQHSTPDVHSDTYAQVDNSSHQTRKKPPPIAPKPYSKSKDNVDAPHGGKKKSPPISRPYGAHNDEEPTQPHGKYSIYQ
jgi:hypothetical protein